PAGAARQQRYLLRMEGADRRCGGSSCQARDRGRARSHAAVRRQGEGNERLLPRSRRIADGIHLLCGVTRRREERPMKQVLHAPTMLPHDPPVPVDAGATPPLAGTRQPDLSLTASDGTAVNLAKLSGRTVVYVYPRTGQPGKPTPTGWDAIPGARGC